MLFKRIVELNSYKSSILLLGPRMVGKSRLLADLKVDLVIDLLDPTLELQYKRNPKVFYEEIKSLPQGSTIIVDEIQRATNLLDYVQIGIEKLGHRFLLSGSSARKLKRGGANLLGGRAISIKLHPLSVTELADLVNIDWLLQFGSIPKVYNLLLDGAMDEAKAVLRTYVTIYLKEEVQAESIVRNLGAFTRFLEVAAQFSGELTVYQNIATSSGVPRSTVAGYFELLEDTLIGQRIWQLGANEKDKTKPKFYLFDCGLVRALLDQLDSPPTPDHRGQLFETFFFNELTKIRDYSGKIHRFSYWQKGKEEIDFIIEQGGEVILAIECKSGRTDGRPFSYPKFRHEFADIPILIASVQDERARVIDEKVTVMPWIDVLDRYRTICGR